jgi:hypothetical protein
VGQLLVLHVNNLYIFSEIITGKRKPKIPSILNSETIPQSMQHGASFFYDPSLKQFCFGKSAESSGKRHKAQYAPVVSFDPHRIET